MSAVPNRPTTGKLRLRVTGRVPHSLPQVIIGHGRRAPEFSGEIGANAPSALPQFWPDPPPCAGRSRDRHASDSGVCPSTAFGGTLFPAWSWPRRTRAGRPPQRHGAPEESNPPASPNHIARGTAGRRAPGTAAAHRPAAFRACAISMSTFIYLFLRPREGFVSLRPPQAAEPQAGMARGTRHEDLESFGCLLIARLRLLYPQPRTWAAPPANFSD